jgi:hypothetical protein
MIKKKEMKLVIKYCAITLIVFAACKEAKKGTNEIASIAKEVTYASFGSEISKEKAITSKEMLVKFESMIAGDTLSVKFTSEIKEVCSKKGCWMKLPLAAEKETMVRFKNYGFFMPLDAQGKEVILEGKAFVQITSVEALQHYAEDAGKSKEEIDAIVAPKKEFAFEATGVLLKK